MAVFYQVLVFGRPQGPWRAALKQARQDAIDAGLGEHDEWGQFYLNAPAVIEARHQNFIPDIRRSTAA